MPSASNIGAKTRQIPISPMTFQIEVWVMCAQVALGLGLFGLGCFGPTDAIVDIFSRCVFGFLIAFLAAMQAENFKAGRR